MDEGKKEFARQMLPNPQIKWEEIAAKQFVGRKIESVRYLTKKEAKTLGWDDRSIVLILDDGNMVYPSKDDEGNGAGALFTNDQKNPTIPVIR